MFRDGTAAMIAVSCFFHYSVFFYSSSAHPTKAAEARSRISSSVHSIFSSAAVLASFAIFPEPELWSPASMILGTEISDSFVFYIRLTVAFSVGYFLTDVMVMLRHRSVYSFDAMLHHAIILPFMLLALAGNNCFV